MNDIGPNVSIVIPAYHAEAFVARAIQSVLDQPGINPEIIVVVDGLVDRTADNARGFPKTRVVIDEVNRGASAARNRGLALAQAPYVMFLDADDWVEGPLLQGLIEALDVFRADVAFGRREKRYELGHPTEIISLHAGSDERPSQINNRDLIILFMEGLFIPPCSTMWRADFVREQGGWNENLIHSEDFEIVHRCLIRGAIATLTGKGCGVYYQHVSEHRLTSNCLRARWKSQLLARLLVLEETKVRGVFDTAIRDAIIAETEPWMRQFARWADDDIYRAAEKFFHDLGGEKTTGSFIHQVGCFVLGLRRKERLSLAIERGKKLLSSRVRLHK